MSEPRNPKNERLSNIDPWKKLSVERRTKKKSECPALNLLDKNDIAGGRNIHACTPNQIPTLNW